MGMSGQVRVSHGNPGQVRACQGTSGQVRASQSISGQVSTYATRQTDLPRSLAKVKVALSHLVGARQNSSEFPPLCNQKFWLYKAA